MSDLLKKVKEITDRDDFDYSMAMGIVVVAGIGISVVLYALWCLITLPKL